MIAILGGLGAAIAWAVSTLCSSRSARAVGAMPVLAGVMLIGLAIALPIALVGGMPGELTTRSVVLLLVAAGGSVGGLALVYTALRYGPVGIVAPICATEGALAAVLAVAFGDHLSPEESLVLAVIAVGVVLAATGPLHPDEHGQHELKRAVPMAVTAALLFAFSLVAAGKVGSDVGPMWVVVAARLFGVIAVAVPVAIRVRPRIPRRVLPLIVASGVLEVIGMTCYLVGAAHSVAIAAVLGSQFAAFATIGGYVLFHERLARIQTIGVVLTLVGVTVLALVGAG